MHTLHKTGMSPSFTPLGDPIGLSCAPLMDISLNINNPHLERGSLNEGRDELPIVHDSVVQGNLRSRDRE